MMRRITPEERRAWKTSRLVAMIFREADKQGAELRALIAKPQS